MVHFLHISWTSPCKYKYISSGILVQNAYRYKKKNILLLILHPLIYSFLPMPVMFVNGLVYDFCLPLWYLLVIVLSVLWFMTSVYLFGISWSLYCLSSDIRLLFTSLVSLGHCIVCPLIYDFCLPLWYLLVIVLSVL